MKLPIVPKSLIILIVLAALFIIAYSLYVTLTSGAAQTGVVTCTESGACYWTAHFHAYAPITICGEEYKLPLETGSLTGSHTHEEKNIIHWHDRLPYDKKTKKIQNAEVFTLGAFFDAVKVPFDSDQIADKKNGGRCNGSPGTLKLFVNGKANTEFRNYLWKDRDVIYIIFDQRSAEEIEQELAAKPILFPALGRG